MIHCHEEYVVWRWSMAHCREYCVCVGMDKTDVCVLLSFWRFRWLDVECHLIEFGFTEFCICCFIHKNTSTVSSPCKTTRGGFRHVQHVRPNGGPHKKGPPQETGIFLQHRNMPEIIEIIIRKRFVWRAGVIKCQVVLPAGNWHTTVMCAYN